MEDAVWLSRTNGFDVCPEMIGFECVGTFVTQNSLEGSLLRKIMNYIRICSIVLLQ